MAEIISQLSLYRQVSVGWTRAGGWASRRRHHWHHYRCSPIERFGAADGPKARREEEELAEMIAAEKRRPLYLGGCTPPSPPERLLPRLRPHFEGSLDRVRPAAERGTGGQSMAAAPGVRFQGGRGLRRSALNVRLGGQPRRSRGAAPGKDAGKRFGTLTNERPGFELGFKAT
ncbi:hypothetical protein HPB52_001979 [Rhipicephalus sanguineus]|uniref:Uncharacterized protein n=1 Tax=Rhipicephalus sanguineus TaxID=34632 RepID=A0A9D4SMR6_RHISA|nr:hypothetical protein HPB52_001979 [Rhipicephalus sanguineus]